MNNELNYEIAEVRALADALVHIDMYDDELFKRASPYLLCMLSDKAAELDKKHGRLEVEIIELRRNQRPS
ncbi:hypothetical protein [Brucella sp. LJL56]